MATDVAFWAPEETRQLTSSLPAPKQPPPSQLEKDATMVMGVPSLALHFLDPTADAGRPLRDAASRRGEATGPL